MPLTGPALPTLAMIDQTNRLRGDSVSLGLMLTYPRWSVGLLYQGPLRSDFTATTRARSLSGTPPPPAEDLEGQAALPAGLRRRRRVAPGAALDGGPGLHLGRVADALLETPDGEP